MAINAKTATAANFDKVAQEHANATWFWLILAAIIFYFFEWWALIPAVLGLFAIIQSVSSTKQAKHLRNGTYKIPNPNNGAPNGDA